MNKKVFLAALPAIMVLTSCGFRPAANNKVFLEDTLAHEEIFGGFENAVDLKPRRAEQENRSLESISAPDIGYQIHFEGDSIAIRFVAAIKETAVKAYWRRGVAAPNGTSTKGRDFSNEPQEASKYYLELTDGNSTIKAGEGKYSSYVGFVVYTIHSIPYTDNKDSYVAAYLNLVGAEDSSIHNNSQALAIKIEKKQNSNYESANAFAFNPTTEYHFLQGTIEGQNNRLLPATEHASGDNVASYDNLALLTSDSFGSFYYKQDNTFQFFGYESFATNNSNAMFEATSSGYFKPKFNDTFSVLISRGDLNKIYGSTTRTVSVSFATNYGAGYGNALFIAGDMNGWKAVTSYRLSNNGDDWSGTFDITIGTRLKYVVGPWDGGNGSRWESGDGHIVTLETTSISVEGWE